MSKYIHSFQSKGPPYARMRTKPKKCAAINGTTLLQKAMGNQAVQRTLKCPTHSNGEWVVVHPSISFHYFRCIPAHNLSATSMNNLKVNETGDTCERKTDRIAKHVLTMTKPRISEPEDVVSHIDHNGRVPAHPSMSGGKTLSLQKPQQIKPIAANNYTPNIQCRLVLSGTNRFDARSFFRRHNYSDSRVTNLENDRVEVSNATHTRPPGLEQEIFWSLAQSGLEHSRTLEQLRREINIRRSIVNSARSLSSRQRSLSHQERFGEFNQIGTPRGTMVNPVYWILETPPTSGQTMSAVRDVVIRTIPEVRPSLAIEDIWRHPELYAYECFTSVAFIQYKALLRRMGPDRFDRQFASGIVLRFIGANGIGPAPILADFERLGLEEVDVGSTGDENELIPGDQTFFTGESGFIENAIYIGRGQYFTHPLGIVSNVEQIASYYPWVLPLSLSRYRYRWSV